MAVNLTGSRSPFRLWVERTTERQFSHSEREHDAYEPLMEIIPRSLTRLTVPGTIGKQRRIHRANNFDTFTT